MCCMLCLESSQSYLIICVEPTNTILLLTNIILNTPTSLLSYVSGWEPLLEPWKVDIHYISTTEYITLKVVVLYILPLFVSLYTSTFISS